MNKIKRLPLALGLAAVIGGFWYWSGKKPSATTASTASTPVSVVVARAQSGEMPVFLNVVGRAEAYEGVTIKSRLDGQILSVNFTEGQAVKQGDLLVRLDPGDFNARVAQAEAVVAKDQAQLAKAQADQVRYLGLKARGFVSDEKVNEVRTTEVAAAATLKADHAALELARLQLSYTAIRAPFSGVVGARLVFPGSTVKINDTALAVVNRVDPLYVSFAVPERHLQRLRDAVSKGPMNVQIAVPGDNSASFAGKARFIDNAVDTTTGTIQMKALLDNKRGKLTPGQFLNVSMVLTTVSNAVLVPNEAIQQGTDGNFLYVVKADNTVEVRKLDIIASYQGKTAIAKGVTIDETVVTDGQLRLTPGATVQAGNGEAQPATSAAPAK
ncbi:efflux RND transporter periplasmic adaptor subunit [Dechloromonas sp. XY25]|uniref:Efflux RND transporter periplasmic adaptor subunit n=1 Tax=Dechloromonas hankyongensis TaxID=2908002 RepID=A0ABS9K4Y9_9RHOO|nr:efflux RND transporter periplasmic adaptor subunit [Dechloromonas hankyongensis]MCG2578222.1 efflux RND transporter periplasmic adaptor subunit [Dechloromonas hankyongensis]